MLGNSRVLTMIPVLDLERAKTFYTQKLGLKFFSEPLPGMVILMAGAENQVCLYRRAPSKADHTLATFVVDEVLNTVYDMKHKGVIFESYNTGEIKTDANNIATMGNKNIAWFKDSEGNILALSN